MVVQNTSDAYHDVFPIFVARRDTGELLSFEGTGFILSPGIFVTCGHCVGKKLERDLAYGVGLKQSNGGYNVVFPKDLERDGRGADLALGSLQVEPSISFELAEEPAPYGTDVWSFGYPLTQPEKGPEGNLKFRLNPRFLQGYITRPFYYQHPSGTIVKSYELDMPTPAGLSGAPLIIVGTKKVIGVVYGSHDVATIEQLSRIDPQTGKREPEIQRIISFGLAHYTDTLRNASAIVTNGKSVAEYLEEARAA